MDIYGIKYVTYLLNKSGHTMTVKYYVTDVNIPILSVNGLNYVGYELILGKTNYISKDTWSICQLTKERGLFFILPLRRVKDERRNKVIAAQSTSQDYWVIEGNKAIRVHTRPRLLKFTPTMKNTYPGTDKTTDPWLWRIGPNRTTKTR